MFSDAGDFKLRESEVELRPVKLGYTREIHVINSRVRPFG